MRQKFDFHEDINLNYFLDALDNLDIEVKPGESIEALFRTVIADLIKERIKKRDPVNFEYMYRYGFWSQEATGRFLNDPRVIEELKEVSLPKQLPTVLFTKLMLVYQNASEMQNREFRPNDSYVLVTLFPIFEFIKDLNDDEARLLETHYSNLFDCYTNSKGVMTFRNDLNRMDPVAFEDKYQSCYSGMLENVIKAMIDNELIIKTIHDAREINSSAANSQYSLFKSEKEASTPPEPTFESSHSKKDNKP